MELKTRKYDFYMKNTFDESFSATKVAQRRKFAITRSLVYFFKLKKIQSNAESSPPPPLCASHVRWHLNQKAALVASFLVETVWNVCMIS